MHNFRAVCFLTVSVCLVVCVSANTPVSKEDEAKAAVGGAKEAVTAVRERAEKELNKTKGLLQRVESSKEDAAQALSHSKEVEQDNTEAEEIAKTIQSLSDEVDKLYSDTQGKLSTAVSTLTPLVKEAQGLVNEPEIVIKAKEDSPEDYTETNGKAAALKLEAAELDGNITEAVNLFSGVESTANTMERKAKEAQVKDSQVITIVAVAKIKSMLGKADGIVRQIEEKKSEVNGIVEKLQKDCTHKLIQSNEVIKEQCGSANDALKSAQGAVQNAKDIRTAIQKQKDLADAALTKVKAETNDVSKAKKEATTAEDCLTAAQRIVSQLETALQTAKDSVTNAIDLQQKLKKTLSTTTTEQNNQQTKKKEENNLPVADGTDSHQKDTTIQPTSKDSLDQINNNADQLKDALINGAQNVSTTALTGEKAPAPGAKNDSAMTVSVPLLVALIASAVLH